MSKSLVNTMMTNSESSNVNVVVIEVFDWLLNNCLMNVFCFSGMYGNQRPMGHLQFLRILGMNQWAVELRLDCILGMKLKSTWRRANWRLVYLILFKVLFVCVTFTVGMLILFGIIWSVMLPSFLLLSSWTCSLMYLFMLGLLKIC